MDTWPSTSRSQTRTNHGAKTNETTLINLIKMFRDGPDVSLNGSPTVIPDDGGLVGLGSFAAVGTALDQLLGVVPRAAGVGHEQSHEHAVTVAPARRPPRASTPRTTDDDRSENRCYTRKDHLAKRGIRRDRHAASGVRLLCPVHNAGPFTKLPPDLLDHSLRARPTAVIVRAAMKKGSVPPMNNPITTNGFTRSMPLSASPTSLAYAENRARAVRAAEPMANPLPCAAVVFPIASRESVIARVFRPQPTHLANTARIVRDRPIRVYRHRHTDCRQHADRRYADPVQASRLKGSEDGNTNEKHGNARRLHTYGQSGDQVGRRPRLAGFGNLSNRPRGCVVLGDQTDRGAHQRSSQDGEPGSESPDTSVHRRPS